MLTGAVFRAQAARLGRLVGRLPAARQPLERRLGGPPAPGSAPGPSQYGGPNSSSFGADGKETMSLRHR